MQIPFRRTYGSIFCALKGMHVIYLFIDILRAVTSIDKTFRDE